MLIPDESKHTLIIKPDYLGVGHWLGHFAPNDCQQKTTLR